MGNVKKAIVLEDIIKDIIEDTGSIVVRECDLVKPELNTKSSKFGKFVDKDIDNIVLAVRLLGRFKGKAFWLNRHDYNFHIVEDDEGELILLAEDKNG